MKANKALKRLAKIEALISDVAERYSSGVSIREALQDARAALARVKAAVSSQASSATAKSPAAKRKKTSVKKVAGKAAKKKASN